MDNIFAIGFGLGLRFVVDTVSNQDFKLTGTLVGLWEGVILLHFLKKTPKSSDPYIAFGVRIFVDLVFTESVARMVLVLIWTALGMVLADITPAIWEDVGLKRVWKSFRRDLYTISRMIPTVAFFPPTRTVRFSPSREPSVIVDDATEVLSPSMVTEQTPIDPVPSAIPRTVAKRRVPGHFPMDFSDTDTDTSSLRAANFVPNGRTSRRLSVYPEIHDYDDSISDLSGSQNDLDEGNLSSEATPTGEPPLTLPDSSEIPEIEEEPLLVNVSALPVKLEDGETTPTQRHQPYMPPTPSDSAARWGINRDVEEPLPVRPPSELLPQIPDFLEEPVSEDWEKIQHADYSDDKPPTPPAKDKPSGLKIPKVPDVPPPVPPVAQQPPQPTTPPDDDMKGWDTLESQIFTRDMNPNNDTDNDINATTTNDDTNRQSLPPPYHDYETHEDIYDDPPHDPALGIPTGDLLGDDTGVPPVEQDTLTDPQPSLLPPIPMVDSLDPWTSGGADDFEEQYKRDLEAEELKAKQEAEEAERKAAEEAQRKAEEEAEEEKKRKKAQEKAEREKKEADDALARKKKREEEEAAEKAKKEEAEKKKAEELAAQKKKEAEEAQARRDAAAEEKRKKKEAKEEEKRKKAEEAARKEAERLEAERLKAEEEAARAEAERLQAEEEAARLKVEEAEKEAARLKAEEEEKAKAEEKKLKAEEEKEAARLKAEQDEKEAAERIAEEAKAQEQARLQQELEDAEKLREQLEVTAAEETTTADALQVEKDAQQNANLAATTEEQATAEGTAEDVKTPVVRPIEDNAELPEHPLSPVEFHHPAPSEADTASEASAAPPLKAYERVERMLSLRAQIVEIEAKLRTLVATDSASPEIKVMEKILRKMNRQAERRYTAGISYHQYHDDDSNSDTVTLNTLNDSRSQEKIAEKIEQLLTPSSRSLYLTIQFGKKANDSRKQKAVVGRITDAFENRTKGRTIDVSEEQFSEWLTGYRKLSTREKTDEFTSVWG
ncbi:hypothetical protein JR316_0001873 [Psilocybe cubensis]|uniref:Uncharacterized protein n=1 Tax=Psilocybe cubensis TaxID=181762 RepID=A0ACB8HCQ6_PSICU|nr:hypothetical protein JR316_0001873 [Psilocybe cubensis]KAH9484969.1 hypothetical protein JR316_0001873 [Psilocybe cubensis]